MQTAKQLSVTLVNKPGRLASMLTALSKEKVGFRALAVMDSADRGTVRFVPEDFAFAAEILTRNNIRFETADVLLAEIPNQAGGFRKVCERLAAEHLNIDYAYCAFGAERGSRGGGLAVIRVNDLAKAQKILGESAGAAKRKASLRRPAHTRKKAALGLVRMGS
jgi:hypothetical protein